MKNFMFALGFVVMWVVIILSALGYNKPATLTVQELMIVATKGVQTIATDSECEFMFGE